MKVQTLNIIESELHGLYGQTVRKEHKEILELYKWYDGDFEWNAHMADLAYVPTKNKSNFIKKLIKDLARFMFSCTPEFDISATDEKDKDKLKDLESFVKKTLTANKFPSKLLKGFLDSLIGKRVAIKLWTDENKKTVKIMFRPSYSFVFETDGDDVDEIKKVIYFHQEVENEDRQSQKFWKQKWELVDGQCVLNEGYYDGMGNLIEEIFKDYKNGLDFVPSTVIINDGLTGDLSGESDVAMLYDDQLAYIRLKSDDIDALRFGMFPMRGFIDADEETMANVVIAPNALLDVKSEEAEEGKQAKPVVMEPEFKYSDRAEKAINRIKGDMHELASVPRVSTEDLQGVITSGKGMKTLYWPLLCRCEEKWTEWEPALIWLIESIIKIADQYGYADVPEGVDYTIKIKRIYPVADDEIEEREKDITEVNSNLRSIKSYIKKWVTDDPAEAEIIFKEILAEMKLFEKDPFAGAIEEELTDGNEE